MGDPEGATKIDAARNAATLMVDIMRPDLDYVGLVSFNGNSTLGAALARMV